MEKIEGNGDVMGDIKKFCSIFTPLIKEIDKFLVRNFLMLQNLVRLLLISLKHPCEFC